MGLQKWIMYIDYMYNACMYDRYVFSSFKYFLQIHMHRFLQRVHTFMFIYIYIYMCPRFELSFE